MHTYTHSLITNKIKLLKLYSISSVCHKLCDLSYSQQLLKMTVVVCRKRNSKSVWIELTIFPRFLLNTSNVKAWLISLLHQAGGLGGPLDLGTDSEGDAVMSPFLGANVICGERLNDQA